MCRSIRPQTRSSRECRSGPRPRRADGRARHERGRSFTLPEVLVVISILALLIALLLPSLSAARRESQRVVCLTSLRELAAAAGAYAQSDAKGLIVAAPANADNVALVDGLYDYGGSSAGGEDPTAARLSVWGPNSPNRAENRPLNRMLFGNGPDPRGYRAFQCPGDDGWVEAPGQPRSVMYTGFIGQPFWQATGTSYRANAARAAAIGHEPPVDASLDYYRLLTEVWSMGPYLRGASQMPGTAELILFCESVMWNALWNSRAIDGKPIVDVPGWHGRWALFNVAFVDGHGATVPLTKDNTEFGEYLWERGPGWQFDTMPHPLLPDHSGSAPPGG